MAGSISKSANLTREARIVRAARSPSPRRSRPREVFAILGSDRVRARPSSWRSIAGAFPLGRAARSCSTARTSTSLPIQQRHLGILYQDYALFPHMTVRENIAYGLEGM